MRYDFILIVITDLRGSDEAPCGSEKDNWFRQSRLEQSLPDSRLRGDPASTSRVHSSLFGLRNYDPMTLVYMYGSPTDETETMDRERAG